MSANLSRRLARLSGLALLLAGASTPALAAGRPDARDAKIEALEAQVQQLVADHQKLAAEDQQLMAQAQALAAEVEALKQGQAAQAQSVQSVQVAQAKDEARAAAAAKPSPSSVVTTLAAGRPIWSTADGRFTTSVHAILQMDAGLYSQAAAGPIATDLRRSGPAVGASAGNVDLAHARDLKDGVDFRRARLGVDGTAFGDWDYRLIFDFGGSGVENAGQLYEGWVQYSGLKPVKVRVGAFSPSIGLEDQASTNSMPFLERSAAEDIARGLAAGDTRINAEVFANGPHWLVSGAITGRTVGVLSTGTATPTAQTFGDPLGFVGRVAATPLHGSDWLVHLGAHGSYVDHPADASGVGTNGLTPASSYTVAFSNTQELRVDGTKLINTGALTADHASTAGLELAAQKGPFLLQSEYEHFAIARADGVASPHFHGWYVEGLWMLSGEARKYNAQTAAFDAPPVARPFSLKDGTWGAWEMGVRYSDMDLNYRQGLAGTAPAADAVRGGEEQNLSAGLNWWPNPLVRFMFDYQHVRISRLSPNAALYQTPTGAQIGQSYDTVSVRSQFAF
ncbi:OprO/OprP family phosphate-selective porin [Caulobacter sp. KR2-114]|uniref:OprO/OprP family phosphate-selective porin n=1 Tax=Caulobacter sp. KR2-114 TaxID=3400912 RepID=UPI003C00B330